MSYIGKKGRKAKSISSSLKEIAKDSKILEKRIGAKQITDVTDNFVNVFLRYSEERGMDFCIDHNILELTREGRTPKEILFEKEWKHHAMIEDLLMFLTSRGVFKKKGREYQVAISPERQKQISRSGTAPDDSFEASRNLALPITVGPREPLGLLPKDRKWIEESKEYKVIFNFFDRIISRFVLESMKTGTQPATLEHLPEQLGPLMDSYYMNPSYTIPRMAVIAAAYKMAAPTKILDLNCGTGRCVEELLLFNSNAEIVGVSDNLFHLRVAERNLEVFSEQKGLYPRVEWRVVDYSNPFPYQLGDHVGLCDMVLVNQLFQFQPHENHQRLFNDILSFLKPGGIVAFFQFLRENLELPWPHEWFFSAIQGFSRIPAEAAFKRLVTRDTERSFREIIPLAAYLVS